MQMTGIPFGITDWHRIEPTEHAGEAGVARRRTRHFGEIRVRLVEYSPGSRADHGCRKGHILFCVAGELETELADGRLFRLGHGVSYQVADEAEPACWRRVAIPRTLQSSCPQPVPSPTCRPASPKPSATATSSNASSGAGEWRRSFWLMI